MSQNVKEAYASNRISVRDMVFCGMFAAVTAVMSQISFPLPSGVPVTLQTFAVALCAYTLYAKYGAVSTCVYVLLGAVGVPVFAQWSGGFEKIIGMTGGFIWGFIPMALLCGLGAQSKNKILTAVFSLAGLAVCHLAGVIQFGAVMGKSFGESFLMVSVPYLVKDIASMVFAYIISVQIRKAVFKNPAAKQNNS